jgi:hypothetical protein
MPARTVTFLARFDTRVDTVTSSPGLNPVPCTVNGARATNLSFGEVTAGAAEAADRARAASTTTTKVFTSARYPVYSVLSLSRQREPTLVAGAL